MEKLNKEVMGDIEQACCATAEMLEAFMLRYDCKFELELDGIIAELKRFDGFAVRNAQEQKDIAALEWMRKNYPVIAASFRTMFLLMDEVTTKLADELYITED